MESLGALPASIFLESFRLTPLDEVIGPFADRHFAVEGRGILLPGMQVPNAWWDRPRCLYALGVDEPHPGADGRLAVDFRARCGPEHAVRLAELCHGPRELLEREVVPMLLIRLGQMPGPHVARVRGGPPRYVPGPQHVGTPIQWEQPPTPPFPKHFGPPPGWRKSRPAPKPAPEPAPDVTIIVPRRRVRPVDV